ncbi:MAG: MBL fold metallo-hydrolase [Candidatus Nanohaloarchaea archaeon]
MKLEILGNVQDGGVPHLGCGCEVCEEARENPEKQRYVNAVMLKENDDEDSIRYMIGASPDIRYQIKGDYLDGVFVSHTHLGDITGLLWLGESSLDANSVPVYCTDDAEHYMKQNDPFRRLLDRENVEVHTVKDGQTIELQGGHIEPREVVHRGDYADALSFMIQGGEKKVYYVTDLDKWTEEAKKSVREADIAIVDGCFWEKEELDRYEEVPHPTVTQTMELFRDSSTEIYFTHMNHTNPILQEDSEEREELEDKGFGIVQRGMEFEI